MHKIKGTLFALLLLCSQVAPAQTAQELQLRLNQLEGQVSELQKKLYQLKEELSSMEKKKNISEGTMPSTEENKLSQYISLIQQGRYTKAQLGLSLYVQDKSNPKIDSAYYWLGDVLSRQGKYKEASEAFSQSFLSNEKGADAADALIRLGQTLPFNGQTKDACKILSLVVQKFPNDQARVSMARSERQKLSCSQKPSK